MIQIPENLKNTYIDNSYHGLLHLTNVIPNETQLEVYDGAGNMSSLSLGGRNNGATITGNLTVTDSLSVAYGISATTITAAELQATTIGAEYGNIQNISSDIIFGSVKISTPSLSSISLSSRDITSRSLSTTTLTSTSLSSQTLTSKDIHSSNLFNTNNIYSGYILVDSASVAETLDVGQIDCSTTITAPSATLLTLNSTNFTTVNTTAYKINTTLFTGVDGTFTGNLTSNQFYGSSINGSTYTGNSAYFTVCYSNRMGVNGDLIVDNNTITQNLTSTNINSNTGIFTTLQSNTLAVDPLSAMSTPVTIAGKSLISYIIDLIFPIGSIYISTDANACNPNTKFPGTSWTTVADGRFLAGVGTGQDSNGTTQTFTIGNNAGEYTHTLSLSEMPRHSHNPITYPNYPYVVTWTTEGRINRQEAGGDSNSSYMFPNNRPYAQTLPQVGNDQAHNNTPPGYGVYIWKRIS